MAKDFEDFERYVFEADQVEELKSVVDVNMAELQKAFEAQDYLNVRRKLAILDVDKMVTMLRFYHEWLTAPEDEPEDGNERTSEDVPDAMESLPGMATIEKARSIRAEEKQGIS